MKQKIIKVGNSMGVTIPAAFVKTVGLQAGDQVEVKAKSEKREIVYKFSGIQQLLISSDLLKKT